MQTLRNFRNKNNITSNNFSTFYNQTLSSFNIRSHASNNKNLENFEESEHRVLTSLYKTSQEDVDEYNYRKAHKEKPSATDKKKKRRLFSKYQINAESAHAYPKWNNIYNEFSVQFIRPYFKSVDKAHNAIHRNKQIAKKIVESTNWKQIQKYEENIHMITRHRFYVSKMPKVLVKKIEITEQNISDEEPVKIVPNNEKQNKNITINKRLTLSTFRKIALNYFDNHEKTAMPFVSGSLSQYALKYVISLQSPAFKPTSRSYYSLTMKNNVAYLFGGLSSVQHKDVWQYEFEHKKWTQLLSDKAPTGIIPRYCHSAVLIESSIVIFGGWLKANEDSENSKGEDIIVYGISSNSFTIPKIKSKLRVNARKGHIAVSATNSMLIYGGVDIKTNKIENTGFLYHVYQSAWTKFEIETNWDDFPYLAYHCASLVNDYKTTCLGSFSFYRTPNDLRANRIKKICIEGVYIFGGWTDKGTFSNELYIIKICRKPCKMVNINTKGMSPCPRINAKMFFVVEYNLVIVHGGEDQNQNVWNDIFLLDCETWTWIRPVLDTHSEIKEMEKRTEHNICYNNDMVYILGGTNGDRYLKMNFENLMIGVSNY